MSLETNDTDKVWLAYSRDGQLLTSEGVSVTEAVAIQRANPSGDVRLSTVGVEPFTGYPDDEITQQAGQVMRASKQCTHDL